MLVLNLGKALAVQEVPDWEEEKEEEEENVKTRRRRRTRA